jgi:hypothetical protein
VLRLERERARLTVVSRLARPPVLVVLAGALALCGAAAARVHPAAGAALAAAGALVAILGSRAVRARFERDRVRIRPANPFQRERERRLADFAGARVETLGEVRRRKAERLALEYRARSGAEMPGWLRRPVTPGANDHLRRVVLLPRAGEPLAVTAWLAEEELEPARAEIEAMLGT